MASLDQVIAQIRFQIDQLSGKNAHHDFEHLCRHLTRARICSNILPATGPVSAGGDQGRDFETFRTYLSSTSIGASTFIGLAKAVPTAFACSLQKKISSKIKSDVGTIMAFGSPVQAVHYFCSSDVPISKRHKLQAWARETYSLELEIHDGQSLSELLAGRDVFWIAEKFLGVPAEIYPRSEVDDGGEWYRESLARWKKKTPLPGNHADFMELKVAARHALVTKELSEDLPFWIRLLETYASNDTFLKLRRIAVYEAVVLSLRGLGTSIGYESSLREYFSSIPDITDPTGLEDAYALLSYCIGAVWEHRTELQADELSTWMHLLVNHVDDMLLAERTSNMQSMLLRVRGFICLLIDPIKPEPPRLGEAIKWWLKLTRVVQGAPMFPLERFADQLTQLIESCDVPKSYFGLTRKLDVLLSNRVGRFIAAEKSRERATALYNRGQILGAIDLLHGAKVDWYAAETLRGSLLAMLFITKCYLALGLTFAAKYYALAVAFIGLHSSDPALKHFVSRGLLRAALCDYLQGAACGFMDLTNTGLSLHFSFSTNAGDLSASDELQSIVFHLVTLKAISERLAPHFDQILDRKIQEWGLPGVWVDETLPTARQSWGTMSDEELQRYLAGELCGAAFSDLGPTRAAVWSQLGVTWKVTWKNDYDTTKEAEQFVAVLQIFLTEVAGVDLCLLRTTVEITIEDGDQSRIQVMPFPSNKGRLWRVRLPCTPTVERGTAGYRVHSEVFAAASTILFEISLLPQKSYEQITDRLVRKGLTSKTFVAQPYERLYCEFVTRDDFESLARDGLCKPKISSDVSAENQGELAWKGHPGPGYSKKKALTLVRNRYANVMPRIQFTLTRILLEPQVMKTISGLRQDGWPDWHILSAIAAATLNYRFNQLRDSFDSQEAMERAWTEVTTEWAEWEPVPSAVFTRENLIRELRMTMLSTLQIFGLECHQQTPDIEAIDHFLSVRYNYWNDDVEHQDPFAARGAAAQAQASPVRAPGIKRETPEP